MSRSESLVAPPVTKACAMTTERPAARGAVGVDPGHRGAQHPGVGALGGAEGVGRDRRLEVGQGVDRDAVDDAPAAPMDSVEVRMCSPARDSSSLANPSRIAESWLPLDRTTAAPASIEARDGDGEQLDGVGGGQGAVVDVTETRTASTPSARTVSTRWSTNAAWAPSSPTWWNERPRCQSEVWRNRTPAG